MDTLNMGLLGDINEAKQEWNTKSIGYKTIVIFSLFMAVSSITSLSETIIKWKGFIKDGVEFYKIYYLDTLSSVFQSFNINISTNTINLLTLLLIYFLPFFLSSYSIFFKDKLVKYLVLITIIGIALRLLFFSYDYEQKIKVFLIGILLIPLWLLLFWYEKRIRVVLFRPIVISIVILVLAAINKGLQ